jgi:hypothetical protein
MTRGLPLMVRVESRSEKITIEKWGRPWETGSRLNSETFDSLVPACFGLSA